MYSKNRGRAAIDFLVIRKLTRFCCIYHPIQWSNFENILKRVQSNCHFLANRWHNECNKIFDFFFGFTFHLSFFKSLACSIYYIPLWVEQHFLSHYERGYLLKKKEYLIMFVRTIMNQPLHFYHSENILGRLTFLYVLKNFVNLPYLFFFLTTTMLTRNNKA